MVLDNFESVCNVKLQLKSPVSRIFRGIKRRCVKSRRQDPMFDGVRRYFAVTVAEVYSGLMKSY